MLKKEITSIVGTVAITASTPLNCDTRREYYSWKVGLIGHSQETLLVSVVFYLPNRSVTNVNIATFGLFEVLPCFRTTVVPTARVPFWTMFMTAMPSVQRPNENGRRTIIIRAPTVSHLWSWTNCQQKSVWETATPVGSRLLRCSVRDVRIASTVHCRQNPRRSQSMACNRILFSHLLDQRSPGCSRNGPTSRRRASHASQDRRGRFLLYLMLLIVVFEEIAYVAAGRDYYDILGVARDADAESIKRAFRKLTKEHHPDKHKGDKAAERFYASLNNAYEVLSDAEKRQQYDMFGEAGLNNRQAEDFGDPFADGWMSSFFGGSGRRRRQQQEERKSPDIVLPLTVSLETLYNGGVIEASHKRRVQCSSWSDCESKCSRCGGSGIVITTHRIGPGFVQQMQQACPKCRGSGKITKRDCASCPHGQFEEVEKGLLIDIERGAPDGYHITFEGQSDEIPDHVPGNLHFEIDTLDHAVFSRRGHDLHYSLKITLTEALIGIHRAVKQLDGRTIPIKTTSVTKPNDRIVISGEGMPHHGAEEAGDMIVHVWVEFPGEISAENKQKVIELHGEPPATQIGNDGAWYNPNRSEAAETDDRKNLDVQDEL